MSRYLTPGKIALLILVKLYAESRFPNAAVAPVVSFIIKHLVRPKDTSTFILSLDQIKDVTISQPCTIVGRTLFDLLLSDMWQIDSFDALHTFFTETQNLLRDPEKEEHHGKDAKHIKRRFIGPTSILGCFIRRANLEFAKLQFQETHALWCSFVRFREPTLPAWRKRKAGAGVMNFDVNLKRMSPNDLLVKKVYGGLMESNNEWTVSTDDVERLLEFQVETMQRFGTRVPDETQRLLKEMLDTDVPVSHLRHYVNFLNAWRSGDYPSSFDCLHRYFDYTMHSRDRTFYQYALLNLAILQADFGCHRESVLAMQETINTARENKDMACLNFALSWLYHFHRAHPQDCPDVISSRMERESLQFLKAKAKEWSMDHLLSMAYLSEARQILLAGDAVPSAFESLLRSGHINVTQQIYNAMGSQILLHSTLWSRLGISHMAGLNCTLFLSKYHDGSPSEDLVVALCRSAYIISMRGRFDEALDRLEQADPEALRSLKIYQYWASYIGLIKLRRAVFRNEFSAANLLLQQLTSSEQVEPDCALEISIARIELQMRTNNYVSAMAHCNQITAEVLRDRADSYHRVRLMILKAEIMARRGRPLAAISTAVSAASIAWKARFLPVLFYAFSVLAMIMVDFGLFEAAYELLDCIMPQVLECEDAYLTAHCFAMLADSQMGMASKKQGLAKTECLGRALALVDRAYNEYTRIQDVHSQKIMMSHKIRIHDYLGDKSMRDECVKQYKDVERGPRQGVESGPSPFRERYL
ncbi:anaphase-promoting complex subunit 5-domain-containing protein [Pyronema omphalodes]|nr:anaphase-promoting complex subunit 5-domain-containing protein [Pyronema omphalodes]